MSHFSLWDIKKRASSHDLSRGCSIEDVYRMIAITANQAIAAKANK